MFMTVDEVAAELKVDVSTIRSWIRSGQLPATKVGRQYRVNYKDYDEFLKSRKVGPGGKTEELSALFA